MKKFIRGLLLILVFISCNFNYEYVNAEGNNDKKQVIDTDERIFDITSDNVILYNLDDKSIIYEENSDEKVQIASLTKIMTTLVAIENIDNLEEKVTITSDVFRGISEYSQAGLSVGDEVTYKDLLYGVMLPSGADSVNAIVMNGFDSNDAFVKLMNDKAKEIGLDDTKFDNAIGMDSDDNYSTASDVAKLLMYALDNETFNTIFKTKTYTIPSINLELNSTLVSYGGSLDTSNILGAKSGFTDGAGLCLASIANYNDINYLEVVLGADTASRANAVRDSLEIYSYYAKNYDYVDVIKKGQVLEKIDVKWGKVDTYSIKGNDDVSVYLRNTVMSDDLEYNYKGVEELTYKNKKGDKLGVVTVSYDGRELTSYDVYLNDDIEYYHPVIYTIMGLAIVLMIISIILIKKNKRRSKQKKRKKRL